MDMTAILASAIFLITFIGIVIERVHKTILVLLGGTFMVILGVVTQENAFAYIDLGVIFLLTGLMIIVHFLAESGFFGYVAIRIAQIARGRPIPLAILLCVATAGLSALVDNVTTVLLMAPIILLITDRLEVRAIPYLLLTVFASNFGGAATLIGDPPNILIGSASGLSFNAFLIHLAPPAFLAMTMLCGVAVLAIRRESFVPNDVRARIMQLNAAGAIRDKALMRKTLGVLGAVLVAFMLHDVLYLEPATVALAGAAILLVIVRADPEQAFKTVEWPTLFFFVGLFMMVAGLSAAGVLEGLARLGLGFTGDSLFLTSMLVLWFTAFAAACIGNVPITTALIPVVYTLIPEVAGSTEHSMEEVRMALWWSLALGACFGGNMTIYGSAANIVVTDIARANRQPVSFLGYFRASFPVTLAALAIASLYVAWRYI